VTGPLSRAPLAPVRYRYYFTDFRLGRLKAVLPLLDVSLSDVLRGAATGSAKVPLGNARVRAQDPFSATTPARSCMWAERQEFDPASGVVARRDVMWGGVVMARSRQRAARTMTLGLVTWPSYLSDRLVGDHTYTQADKAAILRDLLLEAATQPSVATDPPGLYPLVPPPLSPLSAAAGRFGVLADRTYLASDLKNALDAVKELGASGDGFDWRFTPYRDPLVATVGEAFKVRCDSGYPRLGRVAPPDLRWSSNADDSRSRWGWVEDYTINEDRSAVYNRVTALGDGTGPTQLRATKTGSDVGADENGSGYPLYETSLMSSTQDDRTQDTVDAKALGALRAGFASQVRVTGIKVRGDLAPKVYSYQLGDDITLALDETTNGQPGVVVGQLVGRTLEPPQQGRTETVTMDVQGTIRATA
jgi:hypothetical protein